MNAATVIRDTTTTLEKLLVTGQNLDPMHRFKVSLGLPAEDATEKTTEPMNPRINLYIFLVEENSTAKNQDWEARGSETLQKPPLALNLYYVLTPFAATLLDEHLILGEAMRVLYDHAVVDSEHLEGALPGLVDDLKLDLCAFDIEELTRIWNAFNQPYRLSVCYRVRIVPIESALARTVVRVSEKRTEVGLHG